MTRGSLVRRSALLGLMAALATSASAQWPPQKFTNLKVLRTETPPDSLIRLMGEFTRALGVRCVHCHVGEEGKPIATYRFADDDKVTKRKARTMMRMVDEMNGRFLAQLDERVEPPARIQCETCHRGDTVPRPLKEVMLEAYRVGGLDSAVARYHRLRDRYYGRATFDFGSVPLADVASELGERGKIADAVAMNALNVEMNPTSEFARRQYVYSALLQSFQEGDADASAALYVTLRERFGAGLLPETLLNRLGYDLLGSGRTRAAIAAFRLNVEHHPNSVNAHDSLGDAYAKDGDRRRAIESYERALAIDAGSAATRKKLEEIRKARGRR